MGYTSPTTRATGNSVSAAQWNADMVDNVKWLGGDAGGKPSCRVYNNAALAIVTATATALTFNSELWDKGSLHSTVSNTSRITIPAGAGGIWQVGANVDFAGNATGSRYLAIAVNGSITYIAKQEAPVSSTANTNLNVNTLYLVAAADYFEAVVFQSSGGNLNVAANSFWSPHFWASWVGLP